MRKLIKDFYYNDSWLSDFDLIMCDFNNSGIIKDAPGVDITFNTFKQIGQDISKKIYSSHETPLTSPFSICKNPCDESDIYFDKNEIREIMKWLTPNQYKEFRIDSDDYDGLYFLGYFNITKKNSGNKCIGFDLTFISNSPFAYRDKYEFTKIIKEQDTEFYINIDSDEQGIILPHIELQVLEDTDISILNIESKRATLITECKKGELITLDCYNKIITSTDKTHSLSKCFNFIFQKLYSKYNVEKNTLIVNGSIKISVKFNSIRKIGLI